MSRLLLVRHGNTELDSASRFWGQADIKLSAEGQRQAECLRDRLAAEKIDVIYTSTLSRAVATAGTIASNRKLKIVPCAELREINFGYVEGLTFEEIGQRFPELAEAMANRKAHPGFPGGESIEDLDRRVGQFLPRLEKHKPEDTVLVVAHSGVLRLLTCHLLKIGIEHWRQLRLDLASLSILDTYPQGAILSLLNDVSHLKQTGGCND